MVGIVVFGLAILSSDAPLLTVHHLRTCESARAPRRRPGWRSKPARSLQMQISYELEIRDSMK
jgi:hypothetical protein